MKVFINAVSIKEGGSRVVLLKLLAALNAKRSDIEWVVAADPALRSELEDVGNVDLLPLKRMTSFIEVLWWYERDMPRYLRESGADLIFSLTNYLPLRRLVIPTLLLVQHAGYFSVLFEKLNQAASDGFVDRLKWKLRQYWVKHSVKKAALLTVQTDALANAIAAEGLKRRRDISVIPHGPGQVEHRKSFPAVKGSGARIGYITKWGVQKNFLTLFKAIKILKDQGVAARLVLTLNADYPPNRKVLQEAADVGIENLIENHGEVSSRQVASLYDSLDVFVFPSLCESFGFPMVEAMARGLPIIVADTAENREVTGSAALSFPPFDAEKLACHLSSVLENENMQQTLAQNSREQSLKFSWEATASKISQALDETFARARA